MLIKIYSIKDLETNTFDTPFFSHNDTLAKRHFIMTSNNENSMIHNFPDQFCLYSLGEFDTDSGNISTSLTIVLEGNQILKK